MTGVDVLARTLPSLLLIVGALLLLRHWAQRSRGPEQRGIRVETRTGIAKGTVVAVLAVGERRLLVGASEQGVRLLTELDPVEAAATEESPEPDRSLATTDPVAALRQRLGNVRLAGLRAPALPAAVDRPRMAPMDRLRHLTVRRAVPSHPRRPVGARSRT